jgi:cell division FtsZ-interacting protein ZapD
MPPATMEKILEKKIDRELASLAKKLNISKDKTNYDMRGHYLMKIQQLLNKRVCEEKDLTPLPTKVKAQLSPDVVEIMKQQSVKNNEQIVEECARILYCFSKIDPSYKKGVGRLFQAMQDHPQNLAIQRASAGAIRNVLAYTANNNNNAGKSNSDSAPRIASSIGVVLQSMDRFPDDVKLWNIHLEIMAHVPFHLPLKPFFVSSGALQHTLVAMKHHLRYATVQVTAYQILADLSLDSSHEIKRQMLPSIPLLVLGMKQHTNHIKVQRYGCTVLNHLSSTGIQEIVSDGGIDTIVVAMKEHRDDVMVQEQACAALSKLLLDCPLDVMNSMTQAGDIIATVLQSMARHATVLEVQRLCLGILSCLCARDKANYQRLLSEGGLEVVFATMTNFQTNVELAQVGCELLKDVTRQSLDFQRAVTSKGGIVVVLSAMRKHLTSINVQDPAFACIRNICTQQDNRLQAAVDLADLSLDSMSDEIKRQLLPSIPLVVRGMKEHASHPKVQRYGCTILNHLSSRCMPEVVLDGGIETIVVAMKGHGDDARVQEQACAALSKLLSDCPLDAMNTMTQKGGIIATVLQSMASHAKVLEVQRLCLGILSCLCARDKANYQRLLSEGGLEVILATMANFQTNAELAQVGCEFLRDVTRQSLAFQRVVTAKGGIVVVLSAMRKHLTSINVQDPAFACIRNICTQQDRLQAAVDLADLAEDSSDEIKRQLLPSIPLLVLGMKQHTSRPKVQRYGCTVLNHLSSTCIQEIVSVGGIETIVVAMKWHGDDARVQEQACAALSKLLSLCPASVMNTMTQTGGIIATILESMASHAKVLEVQRLCLRILASLCARDKANYQRLLSEGGLEVVFATMTNFQTNVELAQVGCELLKDVTRQSHDFQRVVTAKGGIVVVLSAMRKHLTSISVQDPAFACMRNICTQKDNRLQVAVHGGISTLVVVMSVYIEDAAIQAYGCDALGRLAFEPENRQAIESEHGIDAAIEAMNAHRGHAGVQSRAVLLLLAMAEYEPALVSIKDQQILAVLKETRVPPKKEDIHRLEQLIDLVDGRTKWFGTKGN